MAIKRLTIELDDSQDISGLTSPPESLFPPKNDTSEIIKLTGTPQEQDDYHKQITWPQNLASATPETIGRTPSDLIFAFINRPEFIATTLTGLSFIIFVTKIEQVKDFWRPLTASVILNIIWFGLGWIRNILWLLKR